MEYMKPVREATAKKYTMILSIPQQIFEIAPHLTSKPLHMQIYMHTMCYHLMKLVILPSTLKAG